jgi:hypothetical protein
VFGHLPVWLAAENGVYVRPPPDELAPHEGVPGLGPGSGSARRSGVQGGMGRAVEAGGGGGRGVPGHSGRGGQGSLSPGVKEGGGGRVRGALVARVVIIL